MILFRLVGLLFDLLLAPLRALRRARAIPSGGFATLTIDGPVADVVAKPRFWQVRAQRATSLHDVAELVSAVIADPRARGIVVVLKSFGAGMASAVSLYGHLRRAREAGKEVVVHLPVGGGTKEVIVAMGASRVVVGPSAQLTPLGFLSRTTYVKRALDRVGVEPKIHAVGEFKTAGETLVRDDMSEGQRLQVERMLDGFHGALVDAIAEGRGLDRDAAAAIVDGAPYYGEAAIAAKLADAVAYEDELPATLGVKGNRLLVDAGRYLALRKRPLFRRLVRAPYVAVVPMHGTITHAAGAFGSLGTDERVIRMLRAARSDRRARAVVLHVDSPGGSALASDRMHHEIVQLAREKPLVACMANVAASGGYYVAAPAHRIICEKTTVTGSIGVVGARLSIAPLLAKVGVSTVVLRKGKHAGLLSATGELDASEEAALDRELSATYAKFVRVVAEGRKMEEPRVEELARGRVYTGSDALEVGLVDALGGFDEAMREVKRLLPADVRDAIEPEVVRTPRRELPILDPPNAGEAGRRAVLDLVLSFLPDVDRSIVELTMTGERILAILPRLPFR